ncbi:MAG: hypothetical protein MI975_05790 [Cytophagales bacterium]|nr:hypothetical protein [Cytophagales bacterium]
MKMNKRIIAICFGILIMHVARGQSKSDLIKDWTETKIDSEELLTWEKWGKGEISKWRTAVCLKETDETSGVMLVSPKSYGEDVVVKYRTLALTPATVMVMMLSVSNDGDTRALDIPQNYDGGIGPWLNEKENYFFAYRNAPHGVKPFVRKNPNSSKPLIMAEENIMIPGLYYDVEIGRSGAMLWLTIDDKRVFEVEDENPLSGGHIAIRIRGTAGFKAACMIKDFTVYSSNEE